MANDKKLKCLFVFLLLLKLNCIMTEKQACYHDIKREGGNTDSLQCLILPLYFQNSKNEPGKSEKDRQSIESLINSTLVNCAEEALKSEKCKKESDYKLTIRS
jgi:hypothetical protein